MFDVNLHGKLYNELVAVGNVQVEFTQLGVRFHEPITKFHLRMIFDIIKLLFLIHSNFES